MMRWYGTILTWHCEPYPYHGHLIMVIMVHILVPALFAGLVWPAANFPTSWKADCGPERTSRPLFQTVFGVMKPCWILIYKCHAMFIHLDDLIPGTLFISFHEKLGLGSHLEHYWTIDPQPQVVHERQRSRKPKRKPPELWSERAAWRPLVKVL